MKPVVVLVGADKGGVGKTTITRTLLDYLAARNTPARAFDSEFPRGALKRFHPKITQIIDLETAADQIKVIDTLSTSDVKVSVIDVRAGLLLDTLKTFAQVGFFDLVGAGESISSCSMSSVRRLPRLRKSPRSGPMPMGATICC